MSRKERLSTAPILEKCPWCKVRPVYVGGDSYKDWGVECQNVKCPVASELEDKYNSPEEAAMDWNKCKESSNNYVE